jgi:uncharacterized protein (TIRG00374 family)
LGQALLIGKTINALLPARAGDAVRIYIAGEPPQISRAVALGTIAAEKAFDVFSMVVCGLLATVLVPLPPWLDMPLVGGVAGGLVLVVLAMAWPERRVVTWVRRRARRLPWGLGERLTLMLERALTGLSAMRQLRMALTVGVWTAVIWVLAAGTNYLLFRAFGFGLSPAAAVFLLVLLHAGVAPPSSPGRLGVFHTLTVLGLEVLGVHRVPGLAYATVLHAIVYLPEILPGAILLGLRLAAARKGRSRIVPSTLGRPPV